MNIQNDLLFKYALKAGGAPVMWAQIIMDALPQMKRLIPSGSNVLVPGKHWKGR